MSSLRLFAVLGSVFILGTVFYLLEAVLIPFVAAWVMAYLLVPVVDLLDRWMPRWLAIILSFLMLAALLTGLCLELVPVLRSQISLFLQHLPAYVAQLDRYAGGLISHLHLQVNVSSLIRGFLAARGRQGIAICVGDRPDTHASYRLADVRAVEDWLRRWLDLHPDGATT